jgi:hypothetical protein
MYSSLKMVMDDEASLADKISIKDFRRVSCRELLKMGKD